MSVTSSRSAIKTVSGRSLGINMRRRSPASSTTSISLTDSEDATLMRGAPAMGCMARARRSISNAGNSMRVMAPSPAARYDLEQRPPMSIHQQKITGLVLAGGRGSRMGGVDKGLQLHLGTPLALHALNRLRPQVAGLMLNANRNLEVYEAMGAPVWPDEPADFAGPLAGMLAGLSHCPTPYLATVPCDSPDFPLDLVARLMQGLTDADVDMATA